MRKMRPQRRDERLLGRIHEIAPAPAVQMNINPSRRQVQPPAVSYVGTAELGKAADTRDNAILNLDRVIAPNALRGNQLYRTYCKFVHRISVSPLNIGFLKQFSRAHGFTTIV